MTVAHHLPPTPGLTVRDLSHAYYDNKTKRTLIVLKHLDLKIAPGEFVCIVGPSGCGKSTLLRLLAGLEKKVSGELETGPVPPSVVFQENSLYPWLSVENNISYPLRIRGVPRTQWGARIDRLVEVFGLQDFRHALPHQLSGGMKQRTSVARALASDRPVLLMDEPFGALDEQTRSTLQQELLRVWELSRKTVMFITHSVEEAMVLADRILVMSNRPGEIIKEIKVPFARPRDVIALRRQPEFGELTYEIWQLLRHNKTRET